MKHDKNIADARRLARAMSRDKGIPYQTVLDDIARAAGRDDWKAFVLDPAAVPAETDPKTRRAEIDHEHLAEAGERHEIVTEQSVREESTREGGTRRIRRTMAIMMAAVVLMAGLSVLVNIYLVGRFRTLQYRSVELGEETMKLPRLEIPGFRGAYPISDIKRVDDFVTYKTVPVDARMPSMLALPAFNDPVMDDLGEIVTTSAYSTMVMKLDCKTGTTRFVKLERRTTQGVLTQVVTPKRHKEGLDLGKSPRLTWTALCSAKNGMLLEKDPDGPKPR